MYFKIDEAVTLKRTSAATWLTAHGGAVPSLPPRLPLKPTRKELAVIIALAETYGAVLYTDARYVVVLDFVADHGAVELVQRVMWGARPETDFDVTAFASKNALLADTLRGARFAFLVLVRDLARGLSRADARVTERHRRARTSCRSGSIG